MPKKIKKNRTRKRRPRGQHAINAEANKRAAGQAWLVHLLKPVKKGGKDEDTDSTAESLEEDDGAN